MNPTVLKVTERITRRSEHSRRAYLERLENSAAGDAPRHVLSCGNLAHGMAACTPEEKEALGISGTSTLAIVTSYNDMLSAHQPFERFPELIRIAARKSGAVAQVAGGVPAMCDGVTQGQPGMELSLFSRDLIAMATAVALSHDLFDGALYLGVCDKIVPGLLIGALSFGHLPGVFVPAGPMPSGLPNKEKARVREEYAAGRVGRRELLAAESASYHSPGTCTFYGTANSNQMLMEFMGLQLPGGSFVNPGTELRDALTAAAVRQVLALGRSGDAYTPIGRIVSEKAVVNAIAGLLATGGSTNHTIHLVAIAAAAGIQIDWEDFSELSAVIPLMARVYPNGQADVNQFHAAGGLGFCLQSLLQQGLVHEEVETIVGFGLSRMCQEPQLQDGKLVWRKAAGESLDSQILRPAEDPFDREGGLKLVKGNLGRAIVKISAVAAEHRSIEAPARVFDSQQGFIDRFNRGEIDSDCVVVISHQGPSANGMPELHKLTPYLSVLQRSGLRVALLTDGRMSGASGQVLSAIHLTPDTLSSGMIGRIQDGDLVRIDTSTGVLELLVEPEQLAARSPSADSLADNQYGLGRELFRVFRQNVGCTEKGASVLREWN